MDNGVESQQFLVFRDHGLHQSKPVQIGTGFIKNQNQMVTIVKVC